MKEPRHLWYRVSRNAKNEVEHIPIERGDLELYRDDCWARVGHTLAPRGCVSTVFLGLDHGWEDDPPVLYETAWLLGDDDHLARSITWDRATRVHTRMTVAAWILWWLPYGTREWAIDRFVRPSGGLY